MTDAPPPDWLLPLIRRWEERKTPVATFNYDTLIERGYLAILLEDVERGEKNRKYQNHRAIYAAPTYPAEARRGFGWSQGGGEAFAYLKMHGSLNWFYSGAPSSYGEPVCEHLRADLRGATAHLLRPLARHGRTVNQQSRPAARAGKQPLGTVSYRDEVVRRRDHAQDDVAIRQLGG